MASSLGWHYTERPRRFQVFQPGRKKGGREAPTPSLRLSATLGRSFEAPVRPMRRSVGSLPPSTRRKQTPTSVRVPLRWRGPDDRRTARTKSCPRVRDSLFGGIRGGMGPQRRSPCPVDAKQQPTQARRSEGSSRRASRVETCWKILEVGKCLQSLHDLRMGRSSAFHVLPTIHGSHQIPSNNASKGPFMTGRRD